MGRTRGGERGKKVSLNLFSVFRLLVCLFMTRDGGIQILMQLRTEKSLRSSFLGSRHRRRQESHHRLSKL